MRAPLVPTLLIVAASLVLFAKGFHAYTLSHDRTVGGLRLSGYAVGRMESPGLEQRLLLVKASLAKQVFTLHTPTDDYRFRLSELGVQVDEATARELLLVVGRTGHMSLDLWMQLRAALLGTDLPAPVRIDRENLRRRIRKIKAEIDISARPTRLDLERRRVHQGRTGRSLDLVASMATVNVAIRSGRTEADLIVRPVDPPGGHGRYRGLSLSHVLGEFSTVYSLADKDADRAHNLKNGAAALHGYVLRPGASLSYNEVVGPRTASRGYRVAPVLSQGELIDGMAGGSCQLSSTLFAAAFFAGLDLVSSRPHTRLSSYMKMGLDAAVADGQTDLVLRNPYRFPVAISLKVSRGRVAATILGKKRPWKTVIFRRVILKRAEFSVEERESELLTRGMRKIQQLGAPGFKVARIREFMGADGKVKRRERRVLTYRTSPEIVLVGTGTPVVGEESGTTRNGSPATRLRRGFPKVDDELKLAQ